MALNFSFSEDQVLTRKMVREFFEREIAPKAALWDRSREFPHECILKMADMGLMGLYAPKEYGGQDIDNVTAGIIHEEIGRVDCNCGVILYVHNNAVMLISRIASKSLKDEWLEKLVKCKRKIGLALTEPGYGSDFASITTKAERRGEHYIINGEKSYITGAAPGGLDLFIVFVKTGPIEAGHKAISALLVNLDSEGIERYEIEDMGLRGSKFGGLRFNNAKVPIGNIIGEENRGFYYIMEHFNPGRVLWTLVALGAAEKALELTIEYAKQRKVFGKPLAKFEEIQFRIARNYMNIEAAKLLCYKALWLADKGETRELIKIHAMAKWLGVEAAIKAIDDSMQIHGAIGYTVEYPLERMYRDVRGFGWADGSIEIMKIITAREILGREYLPYR
ncbi:MAG: acyl-CoA dehydrogenase family protein [Candidatus Methanomethylicia archaeon]